MKVTADLIETRLGRWEFLIKIRANQDHPFGPQLLRRGYEHTAKPQNSYWRRWIDGENTNRLCAEVEALDELGFDTAEVRAIHKLADQVDE